MSNLPQGGGETLTGQPLNNVIQELCEAKRTALLATPYLSFETRFLHRGDQELHLWATMSKSVADNTLAQQTVRIRFPWALGMWAGPTRILGFDQDAKHRFLRVAIPDNIGPDELRRHWRADRCGKSSGTLGNDDLKVVRITLENLSQGGVSVFSSEPLEAEAFGSGRIATVNLQLDGGLRIQAKVRIIHGDLFRIGAIFEPELPEGILDRLTHWIRPRWEEAKRNWQNRAEMRAQAQAHQTATLVKPEGLLLITSSSELEAQLRPALEDLPELHIAPPAISGLKKALAQPPLLALLHLPQGGLEERRRYRALLEAMPPCPLILLASPQGTALAQELGAEFKALSIAWNPSLGTFLKRMVAGLLKKHSGSEKQ